MNICHCGPVWLLVVGVGIGGLGIVAASFALTTAIHASARYRLDW